MEDDDYDYAYGWNLFILGDGVPERDFHKVYSKWQGWLDAQYAFLCNGSFPEMMHSPMNPIDKIK